MNVPLHHTVGAVVMVYSVLMPVFATIWLLAVTRGRAEITFDEGPNMRRGVFVFRLSAVNGLVWAVFTWDYLANMSWH